MTLPDLSAIKLEFLPSWARPGPPGPAARADGKTVRPQASGARRPPGRFAGREGRSPRPTARAAPGPHPAEPAHPPLRVTFLPEPGALRAVTDQIRNSSCAYPLFSLAKMFLDRPERYRVHLALEPRPQPAGSTHLHQCTVCNVLCLTESAAVSHILEKHRDAFYRETREQVEPPKGNFTSVARCKLNGVILGPTNHHDFQASLMRLYRSQFQHLPFDRFQQSVETVRDPEAVRKWQESVCWRVTFIPVAGGEGVVLDSREQIERHFRHHHFATTVRTGEQFEMDGPASRRLERRSLGAIVQTAWDAESRFPAKLAGVLRERFSGSGLHIFKARRGIQFVTSIRPRPLQVAATDISRTVLEILEFVRANPGCNRQQLLAARLPAGDGSAGSAGAPAPEDVLRRDLHWLVHEGHVVEYHDGVIETASKRIPP